MKKNDTKGPKFPHVTAKLGDGNAFAIMSCVVHAMRRAGVSKADRDEYFAEATKSTYDGVLQTTMKYVNVDLSTD